MLRLTTLCTLIGCSVLLAVSTSHAITRDMMQATQQLKQLDHQMNQIQQRLNAAHHEQSQLMKALMQTEQNMQETQRQLEQTQRMIAQKTAQIQTLQQQINALTQQLQTEQQHLAQHLRARYRMGTPEPIRWLLHQESPETIHRLLAFHQYVFRSRQTIINDIRQTQHLLMTKRAAMAEELRMKSELQTELHLRQQAFSHDKNRRTALAHALSNDIQRQQTTLSECEQHKKNLTRLIQELMQKSILKTKQPLSHMRRSLEKPVKNPTGITKINQGIVLFAPEGSSVVSIAPGKIVFSDWLNGYGLLLIVDHGWGFMTLYANNQSLLKHKGALVAKGEPIAFVGHSGTLKQNGLYFEIRQRGKAINPKGWVF